MHSQRCALHSPKEEARAHRGDAHVPRRRDLQLLQRLILANDVTPHWDARVREVAAYAPQVSRWKQGTEQRDGVSGSSCGQMRARSEDHESAVRTTESQLLEGGVLRFEDTCECRSALVGDGIIYVQICSQRSGRNVISL